MMDRKRRDEDRRRKTELPTLVSKVVDLNADSEAGKELKYLHRKHSLKSKNQKNSKFFDAARVGML